MRRFVYNNEHAPWAGSLTGEKGGMPIGEVGYAEGGRFGSYHKARIKRTEHANPIQAEPPPLDHNLRRGILQEIGGHTCLGKSW